MIDTIVHRNDHVILLFRLSFYANGSSEEYGLLPIKNPPTSNRCAINLGSIVG
jgi:hypothetical protein